MVQCIFICLINLSALFFRYFILALDCCELQTFSWLTRYCVDTLINESVMPQHILWNCIFRTLTFPGRPPGAVPLTTVGSTKAKRAVTTSVYNFSFMRIICCIVSTITEYLYCVCSRLFSLFFQPAHYYNQLVRKWRNYSKSHDELVSDKVNGCDTPSGELVSHMDAYTRNTRSLVNTSRPRSHSDRRAVWQQQNNGCNCERWRRAMVQHSAHSANKRSANTPQFEGKLSRCSVWEGGL